MGVARRALTVEVDEKLIAAARAVTERTGTPVNELYERALRDVLVRDFAALMDEVAADQATRGQTIGEEAALVLAYDELRAARVERRNVS